jgi:hypothetical protein
MFSSFNVRDQVSHPYRTIGKIIVLYILIFKFFNSNLQYRRFWTEWFLFTATKEKNKWYQIRDPWCHRPKPHLPIPLLENVPLRISHNTTWEIQEWAILLVATHEKCLAGRMSIHYSLWCICVFEDSISWNPTMNFIGYSVLSWNEQLTGAQLISQLGPMQAFEEHDYNAITRIVWSGACLLYIGYNPEETKIYYVASQSCSRYWKISGRIFPPCPNFLHMTLSKKLIHVL